MQSSGDVAVRHYRDLIAWQTANQFKKEVIRLLRSSPQAWGNFKFRNQMIDALSSMTSNLAEGFRRYSPREFCRFIDYEVASLAEAEERLNDGILLGYFTSDNCSKAFILGRRCLTASIRLKQSQSRFQRRP